MYLHCYTELGNQQSLFHRCIEWALDYQRVMLLMFDKFDWLAAYEKKKYINWWISSEKFCTLLSDRPVRNNSVIETSEIIPKRVISRHTTDYPIGIIRYY